jgi:hypothetical protein
MKRRRGSDAPAAAGEESDPSIQLPSLPDDILARVFSIVERQAGPKYLAALSCVCKTWRTAFAQSAAWRVLLEQHQRAPRHPRRSWRDLYFAQLRKDAANVAQRHETMLLRLVHGGKNLGPMRRDSPKGLRRELLALGRDLDVDYAFASVARRGRNAPLDAPDEPFRGRRSVNGVASSLSAIQWAAFRGNFRLAGLIEAREAGAAYDAEPRTRTNVTPWTV